MVYYYHIDKLHFYHESCTDALPALSENATVDVWKEMLSVYWMKFCLCRVTEIHVKDSNMRRIINNYMTYIAKKRTELVEQLFPTLIIGHNTIVDRSLQNRFMMKSYQRLQRDDDSDDPEKLISCFFNHDQSCSFFTKSSLLPNMGTTSVRDASWKAQTEAIPFLRVQFQTQINNTSNKAEVVPSWYQDVSIYDNLYDMIRHHVATFDGILRNLRRFFEVYYNPPIHPLPLRNLQEYKDHITTIQRPVELPSHLQFLLAMKEGTDEYKFSCFDYILDYNSNAFYYDELDHKLYGFKEQPPLSHKVLFVKKSLKDLNDELVFFLFFSILIHKNVLTTFSYLA